MIVVSGIGKDFGDVCAVSGLDLEITTGEIFGLLGPNGAGKTTAISMIAGVLPPDRGTASIAGHDIRTAPAEAKRVLGIVPQDLALYEEITARQNLSFFGHAYGLRGARLSRRIDEALELAGLRERDDEPVKQFSGGMKRRLNLAAGLLHRPRALILDEPTVGVDPQSRAHIFTCLRELRDTAILYTSHYMEEVQALCDRVAIIDHGHLIACGSVDELIAEHTEPGIELDIAGDPSAALPALKTLGDATVVGKAIQLRTEAPISAIADAVEGSGVKLRAIRSLAVDLETVFLNLTGRTSRDD